MGCDPSATDVLAAEMSAVVGVGEEEVKVLLGMLAVEELVKVEVVGEDVGVVEGEEIDGGDKVVVTVGVTTTTDISEEPGPPII